MKRQKIGPESSEYILKISPPPTAPPPPSLSSTGIAGARGGTSGGRRDAPRAVGCFTLPLFLLHYPPRSPFPPPRSTRENGRNGGMTGCAPFAHHSFVHPAYPPLFLCPPCMSLLGIIPHAPVCLPAFVVNITLHCIYPASARQS